MSGNKYSNLPDIDTAPDIYETEDVFPSSSVDRGDSSDEETGLPSRSAARGRNGDALVAKEELDSSSLMAAEEASKKFRKAERRRGDRSRTHYAYPPSPASPTLADGPFGNPNSRPVSLSQRLRALQSELTALEVELADPSNPLLHKEREQDHVDPGELIKGLMDVRGRLDKVKKGHEGRGKLIAVVAGMDEEANGLGARLSADKPPLQESKPSKEARTDEPQNVRSVVEMDRRVGDLEKLVGSSGLALDEISPLPPPLLPLISKLNSQLTILTQPRHIDSISRRLKLLLSDLDRASASQHHRRHPSQPSAAPSSSTASDTVVPLLTRLAPSLPHIPHILTRLRTLSSLHTSAAEFQGTLERLEEEQRKIREVLGELGDAVSGIETSLKGNQGIVKGNVEGLEERVESLLRRLEEVGKH